MSRIVITGASSGLGLAIRQALESDEAFATHEVFDFSYPNHDVRNFMQCEAFLAEVCSGSTRNNKTLDVLINCAGVSPLNWIDKSTQEEWDLVMDTNCKGVFNMVRAAIPYLSARAPDGRRYRPFDTSGGGTILNICSTAAWTPMTCTHIYNASKAALHMMTLQMARELGPRHFIDVFGIAPNQLADTGITNYVNAVVPELRGWTKEEAAKKQKSMAPAGEATPTKVVAELIAYLLQNKMNHRFLTGTVLQYGA